MGKNLWLRAKTKAHLKPELKIKALWNTCDKELAGENKSGYETYSKSSLETLQKSHFFRENYVKCLIF